jgi:flagellar biosynthetic protein FlhB
MAAEAEQGGERTEEPSQRRLQDAREHGRVPRSRELTAFAVMIGGSAALLGLGAHLSGALADLMRRSLAPMPLALEDPQQLEAALSHATLQTLAGALPLLGVVLAAVLLASIALGGWNFSPSALVPDFTRLSPAAGFGRLFGLSGLTELGKALLKCLVVGGVCAGVIGALSGEVLSLAHMAPRAAIGRGAHLIGEAFVALCASLALVALVDVPLQIFQFKRALRMTRQELREELKEHDGRPETKARIRQVQQQLARRRMMQQVPKADVVIVNPTHFAVALKYEPARMRAPRVIAKGVDLIAQNIRRIAEEHRVPVFESPPLARALYRSTDLDREIPAGLYLAVAQVLSYIFRIRTLSPTLAARLQRPEPTLGSEYHET